MTTTRVPRRVTLFIAAALLALPVAAGGAVAVHNQGSVNFVSGGVGDEERQALREMSNRFNLKLTMALSNGEFIGDAQVRIQNAQGQTVLDTVSDGPLLYAALRPGTYTVLCSLDGKTIQKSARVASGKQQQLVFTWRSE